MAKKHIITIAGDHASGQGTLTNLIHENLEYEIYRNGQYVRKLATDMGMSIVDFQEYLNQNPSVDKEIEQSAKKYADEHDNLVVDAKLGWYAIPESFKVYLRVDIDVAANRAFKDKNRKNTETFSSIEETKQKIVYRYDEENRRWFEIYGVRREDMSNYDIVVDTTNLTPQEVYTQVKEAYYKWLEK